MHLVAPRNCPTHQRAVDQPGKLRQRGLGHNLCRLAATSAAKDRHLLKHLALLFTQPLPGVVKHETYATVALWQIAQTARQQIQTALDFLSDVSRSERGEPTHRQFDSQWHALHQPANLSHTLLVFSKVEITAYPTRPIHKQLHRTVIARRLAFFSIRVGKARNRPDPLFLKIERFTRGDQELQASSDRQDIGKQINTIEQVLHSIEHQQDLLLSLVAQ